MTDTIYREWQALPLPASEDAELAGWANDTSPPHVLLWRRLLSDLRDEDVEKFVARNEPRISADAMRIGVESRDLQTQVRLHLPAFRRESLSGSLDEEIYERVRLPSVTRSSAIKEASEEAEFHAYASFLLGRVAVRKDQSVTRADGLSRRLKFGYVLPRVGQFYQAKLHYLRSARCDTTLELGVYLDGARYPLTYLSFSICDRPYIISAMREAGIGARRSEVLVLTRMYGLPGVPHNMMSLSLSRAARMISRHTRFRYVVTALNPMLGFRGTAFLAAGFIPFATAPVSYNPNTVGVFSTRRKSGGSLTQELDTPHNLLAVLGVDRPIRKSLLSSTMFTKISDTNYEMNTTTTSPPDLPVPGDAVWLERLADYRRLLESAWSDETIHPGYAADDGPAPASRGQCGVTSVWLARQLHAEFEVDATYCYGTLKIQKPQINSTVDHHCWLEIGPRDDPRRTVIDLTCDQADGVEGPILCERHGELLKEGMEYDARSRLGMNELETDRVWRRFQALRAAVDSIHRDERPDKAGLLEVS